MDRTQPQLARQWRHDEATISPLRRNIARCWFDRGRVRRRAERFPRSPSRYKASLLDALLDGAGGHCGNRTGQLPVGNGRRFVWAVGVTGVTSISVSEASGIG
jgi:hypothetical protein